MQRTFLRSDTEDLTRLHQYYNSSTISRSLRHDIQTFGLINKLVDELERVKGEQNQLIDKNKQLEEALRRSRRELIGAKKEIEQLRVANRNLAKDRHSQEQRPRDTTYLVQSRDTTYTKSKEMLASQHSSQSSDVFENNLTYDVPKNNRKRTADEQHQNASGANGSVCAAKRSLLRKSIESNDTKGESSEYVTACSQSENIEEVNQTKIITEPKTQRRSRRSISLPPDEVPSAEVVSSNQSRILKPHKRENSRLIGVKNTRISSSCDDLSKFRRDLSPPFIDDNPFDTEHAEHVFTTKRNFLRIHCGRCEVAIRFGVLYVKCQRCKATFHEQCRKQAPLPCVIRILTPKPSGPKCGRPRLGDFCADCRPMVPPLITYCTYHLDNCHDLPFEDIYSNCGIAREVELITKLFQSNKIFPKLDNYNLLSVAGCVRRFLAQVREPVVPFTYGKDIIKCLEDTSKACNLTSLIGDLPTAHMDTLAHLTRHWKRLSTISNDRLTVKALSALLGPLVFGSDRTESPIQNGAAVNAMEALLLLPIEFWINITSSPGTSHSSLSRNPSQRSNNNQTPKCKTLTIKNSALRLQREVELNSSIFQ